MFLDEPYNQDAQMAFFSKKNKSLFQDNPQKYIEENQEPIPEQMNQEIQQLINHRRKIGDSEDNIRRLVRKVFRITVI